MGTTNFGQLTTEQKTAHSMDFWTQARNLSSINKLIGDGPNSVIQRISELKKTAKGARAVITIVADMEGDGVVGDNTLEGREETLKAYDQVIEIDQMRNANRHEGVMAEQKSVVNFRKESKDKLAYWLADRMDQMAFLHMSGVQYTMTNNGVLRVGSELKNLEFAPTAADAPSAKRYGQWDKGTDAIIWGQGPLTALVGGAIGTGDYCEWNTLMAAKAYAKDNHIRGVREGGGEETFHVFLSPSAMLKLKQDPVYRDNLRHAAARDSSNPLFTGGTIKLDGLYLHESPYVYNTRLATSGSTMWGPGLNINGCQVLFCGAQALGMADLGQPTWVEKEFDYDNQPGISIAKILGFLKPQFPTQYSGGTLEDHGILSIYCAQ